MPAITPIMLSHNQTDVATLSFRQLDELNGLGKGTSFKLFKAHRAYLQEGRDYFHLPASSHGEWIARLKAEGHIYAGTVHLVLLSQCGYAALQNRLRGSP